MDPFKELFGVEQKKIRKNCLLVPFFPKGLLKEIPHEKPSGTSFYRLANTEDFTLIYTGIGAPFVGDAILSLKNTPCQNIFFLGSGGILPKSPHFQIGDLVVPKSSLAAESFSQILNENLQNCTTADADCVLIDEFYSASSNKLIRTAKAASFGSLILEENNIDFFHQNGIEVVDMETAAFFHAAQKINRRAFALLFITDIIKEKPFFTKAEKSIQSKIQSAHKTASNHLLEFIKRV